MSKIHTEPRLVLGKLITAFSGTYELLSLEPEKKVTWYGAYRFLIIDEEGYGKYIAVHEGYVIFPYSLPEEQSVHFEVEDEENIKVEESEELPF